MHLHTTSRARDLDTGHELCDRVVDYANEADDPCRVIMALPTGCGQTASSVMHLDRFGVPA